SCQALRPGHQDVPVGRHGYRGDEIVPRREVGRHFATVAEVRIPRPVGVVAEQYIISGVPPCISGDHNLAVRRLHGGGAGPDAGGGQAGQGRASAEARVEVAREYSGVDSDGGRHVGDVDGPAGGTAAAQVRDGQSDDVGPVVVGREAEPGG